MPSKTYRTFSNHVYSGVQVYSEYSASDDLEFFVLDSENFEVFSKRYGEGEYSFLIALYHSFGKSDSYTFRATNDDTYYAVLVNAADYEVIASFEQNEEAYYIVGAIGFFSLFFLLIGILIIIVGLTQKSKSVETQEPNGS